MPERKRLPAVRPALVTQRRACGFKLFIVVGFDPDGATVDDRCKPIELFLRLAKRGSEMSGLADALALTVSVALQSGTPWETLRDHYAGTRFGAEDARYSSLLDCVARAIDDLVAERRNTIGED